MTEEMQDWNWENSRNLLLEVSVSITDLLPHPPLLSYPTFHKDIC